LSYVARIRQKYNEIKQIWDRTDLWHLRSRHQIEDELLSVAAEFNRQQSANSPILDVGSGGYAYFQTTGRRVDVDIAEARLARCRWGVCANAEALPLAPKISDVTICVGPVVNYCSLEEVLQELARATKPNGRLVLHVELSNSWEFLGSKAFRADAAFVTTFYKGAEQYWVYSDDYVRRSLAIAGFQIERVRYFHVVSSLVYRVTSWPNFSSYFGSLDWLFQRSSRIRSTADSAIFVCRRARQT
jgi:SAM-dependent methyltransferase